MPIYVDEQELKERLERCSNGKSYAAPDKSQNKPSNGRAGGQDPDKPSHLRNKYNGGRAPGGTNLDRETKVDIAVEAELTTQQQAADKFNTSQPHVGYIERDSKIRPEVEDKLDKARVSALDNLVSSLGHLQDRIPHVKKAVDISSIAANMSRIIEKTSPRGPSEVHQTVVFYTPKTSAEETFPVIDV